MTPPRQCPYLEGVGISLCPPTRKAVAIEGESSGVQQAQGQVEQGEDQQQGGQEPEGGMLREPEQAYREPQKGAEIDALQMKVADGLTKLGKKNTNLKALLADECIAFARGSAGVLIRHRHKGALSEVRLRRHRARESGAVALRCQRLEHVRTVRRHHKARTRRRLRTID